MAMIMEELILGMVCRLPGFHMSPTNLFPTQPEQGSLEHLSWGNLPKYFHYYSFQLFNSIQIRHFPSFRLSILFRVVA